MATAIARGWAGAEGGPELMLFCDVDRERAADLATSVKGETRQTLPEIAAASDVVLLAVKPAALDEVAQEMGGRAPALISVMAATTTKQLAGAFPGVPLLRVMPNQPVEVQRGVICHPPPVAMPQALETMLIDLLSQLGTVVAIDEDRIDAAMAVMSCSPAYVARFASALAQAGEAEGLDRPVAMELVAETLTGTAGLLARHDAEAIQRAVAPPGGATDAGLEALERGGFDQALAAAVEASLERFR
jgi:pyrroline-5-carboxylate reductase